ncbi:phage terminase small subunit [Rossellomorea vietnamensis]|uniref:phage terminase small subunit n=1 Tax=Rossellomorea vietnamensis TaxID=218284 RepID=UPI0005599F7C|nr:phage terminase small subunit [Rossellomorea vietnamensis]
MAENYVKAENDYVKGMKYKDIAEKYGVSLNTVKSWKKRYGWSREKGAHKKKGVHPKNETRGAPKKNKNAVGHGAPKRNQNATSHGFFAKYLPQESLDIIESLQEKSGADMIWDQIQIQYAAIIRAQKIMFVTDKNEMIKELKKEKESWGDGSGSEEKEWDFQFAWDRQATFLNAQSRAMSELRSLIKQFDDIAHIEDERRLKLEQMSVSIDKTKAEITRLEGDQDKNKGQEDWKDALLEVAERRKKVKADEQ